MAGALLRKNPAATPLLICLAFCLLLATESLHSIGHASAAQKSGDASLLRQKVKDLTARGKYEDAIPFAEQFVAIQETRRGGDPLSLARGLESLGLLYRETGRTGDAVRSYRRALAIRENLEGAGHPSVAQTMHYLAHVYRSAGKFREAEALYKRSLEIREQALGKDHPDVAQSLNGLAYVYSFTGNYQESEVLLRKALDIRERAFGKDHPDVAQSLHNLGWLYYIVGRYAEAETNLKKALFIREKTLREDHPDIVVSLQSLGRLYQATDRFSEAERNLKKALEMQERILGSEHRRTAETLNHLGWLYYRMKDYPRAEQLFKKALEIRQRTPNIDRLNIAANLNNLGLVYADTGRYDEAERFHKKALEIRTSLLGERHTYVAMSLANLGALYGMTGRLKEAEAHYRRAVEIRENALGKDHPDVAKSLTGLAQLLAKPRRQEESDELFRQRQQESHVLFTRSLAIYDAKREDVFAVMSERQKMSYMRTTQKFINAFLNHTAAYMAADPSAVRDTLDVWIRWKGAVMEAQGRYIDAVTHSPDPRVQRKFDELVKVRRAMARLILSSEESADQDSQTGRELADLQKTKARLERELSTLSKEYNLDKRLGTADSSRIAGLLPEGSAYIDFALIREFDFASRQSGRSLYLAFVLTPEAGTDIRMIALSGVETIHQHLTTYLDEMGKVKRGGGLADVRILRREARALYDLVMKPLEPFLKGRGHVVVSPDGLLSLIPFEVMMSGEGKYLMEQHLITYVAAGRDIMRFSDETPSEARAVIMADPDYDMSSMLGDRTAMRGDTQSQAHAEILADARSLTFARLPETKQEADAIAMIVGQGKLLPVMNYQQESALEEVLFKVRSPRILHLATHGYFLQEEELRPSQGPERDEQDDTIAAAVLSNPMMRSGIALAGVNTSLRQGLDEGLVSAEKILGLRLKGTDLVVLSACETAVGRASQGEGVFGLKRAFVLSGAKTLVMSLWSVPSAETALLMKDFYSRLAAGNSKARALQDARIAVMKAHGNPFYWGAFVLVGGP